MVSALVYYVIIIILQNTASSLPIHSDSITLGNNFNKERYWSEVGKNASNYKQKPGSQNGFGYEDGGVGGVKRGLDIGVHLKLPTTPYSYSDNKLNKLEDILEKALVGNLQDVLNSTSCPKCDEEEEEEGALPGSPARRWRLKPAYKCDDWNSNVRICILERNVGDTVTFYLSTGSSSDHRKNVTWKKEFHMRDSKMRTEYVIDPGNSPQNIIIGKQGYELRLSPITEIDIGNSLFSATLEGHSSKSKLYFLLRIVPLDLGFVYVGETIELNLRSFVSLPPESLSFRWYMEKYGEHGTLPSNMRTSSTGSSIKISELRQEQEGILACSVYTNLNFLATKKRFLIKDLLKNKDVLESAPNHNLTFTEDHPVKKKRVPNKINLKSQAVSKRTKRDVDVLDLVEKALMKSTTSVYPASGMVNHDTTAHSFSNYELDLGTEDEKDRSKPFDSFQDTLEDFENPYEVEPDLQRSNQYDNSLDTNPVEIPERGKNGIYSSEEQNNNERFIPQMESSIFSQQQRNPSNHYLANEGLVPENLFSRKQAVVGNLNSAYPPMETVGNGRKYVNIYAENKKEYETQTKESQIILNIEKIPGPRHVSSEESISKLISSCYTDFECSGLATCVRNSLKLKGYCKCLPGYYGIGIFCRESVWMSNSNFDVVMHNQDGYPKS